MVSDYYPFSMHVQNSGDKSLGCFIMSDVCVQLVFHFIVFAVLTPSHFCRASHIAAVSVSYACHSFHCIARLFFLIHLLLLFLQHQIFSSRYAKFTTCFDLFS